MEKITSINPERIRWCCRERGIDVTGLASESGIAEAALGGVMDGAGGLTFGQLQRLAKLFNRGILFFMESGTPNEEQVYSPQFRTLTNQKPLMTPKVRGLIQRVERQRAIYLSLREDLGEPVGHMVWPQGLTNLPAGEAGEVVRRWLGLEERNTFDSYRKAVEAKGILVFRTNGYAGAWQIPKKDDLEGFCLYDERCPVIVVKKQAAEVRQVFTLFHELGHLILHKSSYMDDDGELYQVTGPERGPNEFAGRLLVPSSFIEQIGVRERPRSADKFDDWLGAFRSAWSVSGEVLLRRLLDTGRLEQAEYDAYREWKKKQTYEAESGGNRQYRHREPVHIFGRTFAGVVLDALAQNRITATKASNYLDNLKLGDLRDLETYLAGH